MRSGTIAFLAGILLFQQLSVLPSVQWLWGLTLVLPLLLIRSAHFPRYSRLLAWLTAGWLWGLLHAHLVLGVALPAELEGKELLLTGSIVSLPARQERSVRFEYQADSLTYQNQQQPFSARLRLSWYGQPPPLFAGERWQLLVRLKQPHGFMNPGGFDYEGWLYQHHIRATGYVRASTNNQQLTSPWYASPLLRVRSQLRESISMWLPDSPVRGLVLALAIGDRSLINTEQWQWLQRTGTSHLLAISGLHIGLVAGLVFWLSHWLWRFSGRGLLWLPAPKMAAIWASGAAGFYAALAGFSIPTQRAMVMVLVVMLSLLLSRKIRSSYTLALALLCVLIWDPLSVLSPGFWLSFAAVAIILLSTHGHLAILRRWQQWLKVQWWISLGLLPLLLLFFQQGSLVAPLANLFAIPLVSLIVVPVIMLAILSLAISSLLGSKLLLLAAWLLQQMAQLLGNLSDWPLAVWQASIPDIWTGSLLVVGIMLLLAPAGLPGRWLGCLLCLPMLLYQPPRPGQGEVWFTLLDVGQGLAAVVQTREHALVFDTGPRFSDRFDTGKAVVVPFLRQAHISKLDMLVVSHGDNDHIGGVDSLMKEVTIGNILSSVPEKLPTKRHESCVAGQQWQWDGVLFEVLNPLPDHQQQRNNASCVVRVSSGEHAVLLTGDIEHQAEQTLVRLLPHKLHATLLVAPHHGSKTSSTRAFIDAVSPRYVLYPVGYRNRYRFPHKKVTGRYNAIHAIALSTANSGAIGFRFGANRILQTPQLYRLQAQRYWHVKPLGSSQTGL